MLENIMQFPVTERVDLVYWQTQIRDYLTPVPLPSGRHEMGPEIRNLP